MQSLRRLAGELSIPRTLRRAAAEGLVRGERVSRRRFQITLQEAEYLRTHWVLLRGLRAALPHGAERRTRGIVWCNGRGRR